MSRTYAYNCTSSLLLLLGKPNCNPYKPVSQSCAAAKCQAFWRATVQSNMADRIERTMYQRKIDVNMLNAVKSVLADVSSVSPSSEQRLRVNARNVSQHTLYGVQHIHINLYTLIHCAFYRHADADQI